MIGPFKKYQEMSVGMSTGDILTHALYSSVTVINSVDQICS